MTLSCSQILRRGKKYIKNGHAVGVCGAISIVAKTQYDWQTIENERKIRDRNYVTRWLERSPRCIHLSYAEAIKYRLAWMDWMIEGYEAKETKP